MRAVTGVAVFLTLLLATLPPAAQEMLVLPPAQGDLSASSVSFSPDGHLLASITQGTLKAWRIDTGEPVEALTGVGESLLTVAFSPSGRAIVTGGSDGRVRVYDSEGASIRTLTGHTDYVRDLAFSPAGGILASGSDDGSVRLWDMASGELLREIPGHPDYVRSVAFGEQAQLLVTGCDDGVVRLWDADTGELLSDLHGHTDYVRDVAVSPDGSIIASGSDDGTVRLWSAMNGEEIAVLRGHSDWVRAVAFSPDGGVLASGADDGLVNLWDVTTREVVRSLESPAWVMSVAFDPDGSRLATGQADGTVRLWDPEDGTMLASAGGVAPMLMRLALSPAGGTLVAGTASGELYLWDLADEENEFRTIACPEVAAIRAMAFDRRGDVLAVGGEGPEVVLIDFASGEVLRSLTVPGGVLALHFNRPGRLWTAAPDAAVVAWDVEDGSIVHRAGAPGHSVTVLETRSGKVSGSNQPWGGFAALMFSDDGERLTGGGERGALSLALSPNGRLLATGSRHGTVAIGDARSLETAILAGDAHTDYVRAVAFSRDGRFLASASDDGSVKLWSVSRRTLVRTLTGHTSWVRDVLFIDDDRFVSCADDGTARIWSASTGEQVRVLHTIDPRAEMLVAP